MNTINEQTAIDIRAYLDGLGQLMGIRDGEDGDVALYRIEETDANRFPELSGVEYAETWVHGIKLKGAEGSIMVIDLPPQSQCRPTPEANQAVQKPRSGASFGM